jgi:hypothetical protein
VKICVPKIGPRFTVGVIAANSIQKSEEVIGYFDAAPNKSVHEYHEYHNPSSNCVAQTLHHLLSEMFICRTIILNDYHHCGRR